MKVFVIALCAIVLIRAEDLYNEEQINVTRRFMRECADSTRISEDNVRQMMNRVFNEEEVSKNFIFCLYKKLKFMEDNETINKENLRKFFGRHPLAGDTLDKCIDKKAGTPKDTAYLVTKCYMQGLPPNVKGWV